MVEKKNIDKDKFIMGNASKVHQKLYLTWLMFNILFWILIVSGLIVSIIIWISVMKDKGNGNFDLTASYSGQVFVVALFAPYAFNWVAATLEIIAIHCQEKIIKNYSSKNYLLMTQKEKQKFYTIMVGIIVCPPLLACILILVGLIVYTIVLIVRLCKKDSKKEQARKKEQEKKKAQEKIAKQRWNAIKSEIKKPDLIPASL